MTAGPRGPAGLRGHYAGAVSRLVAYAIDLAVISVLFGLALAAVSFVASLIAGHSFSLDKSGIPVAIGYGCWWFLYFAYSWGASGKTFGMAVLGVQIVGREGDAAGPRRALVRALVFPLSFLLLGLGLAGIIVDRERRALHDVIAGTAVVYSWDARAQRLGFLARDPRVQVPAQPGPPVPETAAVPSPAGPAPDTAPVPAPDTAPVPAPDTAPVPAPDTAPVPAPASAPMRAPDTQAVPAPDSPAGPTVA